LFDLYWFCKYGWINDKLLYELNKNVMKKNMGTADRIIRVIIAAVIAGLFFGNVITGTIGIILLVLAGVFLLTSVVSFCPLYAPFGISTCKTKK
jgi:uncharacterized membrane protein